MKRSVSNLLASCTFICGLMLANAALADCTAPKVPESPDGKSASKEEMVVAMNSFKQYNADIETYAACLKAETTAKVTDGSIAATQVMQFKSMQSRKESSARDELKQKVDFFNEQVRTFKARSG